MQTLQWKLSPGLRGLLNEPSHVPRPHQPHFYPPLHLASEVTLVFGHFPSLSLTQHILTSCSLCLRAACLNSDLLLLLLSRSVVSDSVRPHRRQPTRLPRTWDSPGKNTGVGGHFLLQCMKVKRESEVAQSCPTLGNPMDCSLPGSSVHGISQAGELEWVPLPSPPINLSLYVSTAKTLSLIMQQKLGLPKHQRAVPR